MESNLDQGKVFGTSLTDLSEIRDCLPHDLFLTKLQAYGFDNKSLGSVGLKSDRNLVHGKKFYLMFHRVLYFVPFFSSIFNSVINLLSSAILI